MIKYKNEKEFLEAYNPDEFEKLSLTTDILIFSVSDGEKENYRKLNKKHFSLLLLHRDDYPFKDKWCLPGGFVGIKETIDEATTRILERETNLRNIYMEQLYTFGEVDRDPRMRIVSTSYMALINKNKTTDKLANNAHWFNFDIEETKKNITVILDSNTEKIEIKAKKILKNKTTGRFIYEMIDNKELAFDHAKVILEGINRMKNKIEYTDVVFNMMPEYFTLTELQQVYEVILNKKLLDPAFRRVIAKKVSKTNKTIISGGHRPSYLYKYNGSH